MRLLPRARLLLAAAGALLLVGAMTLRPVGGALGLALVTWYLLWKWSFRSRLDGVALEARRRSLSPVPHEDQPIDVETRVEGRTMGLRLAVDARPPPGMAAWREGEPDHAEGPVVTRTYRALRQGVHRFGPVRVRLRDEHALFEEEMEVAAPLEVHVHVSRRRLAEARRAARKPLSETSRTDPFGRLLREFEFAGVRDYAGGDRLRDIDWKRTSRGQGLMTKTFERHSEPVILLVLDASRTMRQSLAGVSRLTRATQLCLETAESAVFHGYRVGMVVLDESRILEDVPPSTSAATVRRVAVGLSRLPPTFEVARRLDVGVYRAGRERDAFLARLAELHPRSHLGGESFVRVARRVAAHHPRGSLLVLALTDLESDPAGTVAGLVTLRAAGHGVRCGVLRGALTAPEGGAPRVHDVERAYLELEARDRAASGLRRRDVRLVDLTLEDGVDRLLEGDPGAPRPAPKA